MSSTSQHNAGTCLECGRFVRESRQFGQATQDPKPYKFEVHYISLKISLHVPEQPVKRLLCSRCSIMGVHAASILIPKVTTVDALHAALQEAAASLTHFDEASREWSTFHMNNSHPIFGYAWKDHQEAASRHGIAVKGLRGLRNGIQKEIAWLEKVSDGKTVSLIDLKVTFRSLLWTPVSQKRHARALTLHFFVHCGITRSIQLFIKPPWWKLMHPSHSLIIRAVPKK